MASCKSSERVISTQTGENAHAFLIYLRILKHSDFYIIYIKFFFCILVTYELYTGYSQHKVRSCPYDACANELSG